MKKGQKILIGVIVAVAVIGVLVTGIVLLTVGKGGSYSDRLDLAQQYIDDLQYEQAIAELRAAIDIEPNEKEAYIMLANIYLATNDIESAIAVMKEGYEATGDELFAEWLRDWEDTDEPEDSGNNENGSDDAETSYESELDRMFEEGDGGNLLTWDEVTFFGNSVVGLDYETAKSLALANGFGLSYESFEEEYVGATFEKDGMGTEIGLLQNSGSSEISLIGISHPDFHEGTALTAEVRGITMRDSLETVLEKLGFENASELDTAVREEKAKEYDSEEELDAAIPWVNFFSQDRNLRVGIQWSATEIDGKHKLAEGVDLHFDYWYEGGGAVWFAFDENLLLEDISIHNNQ